MARLNLDDDMWMDGRFDDLAAGPALAEVMARANWERDLMSMRVARLWRHCYAQGPVVSEALAKQVLRFDPKHLVEADLAAWVDDHSETRNLFVKGVKQRRGYLDTKAEAGRQGGIKSGQSRRSKREADASISAKQRASTIEASGSGSSSGSGSCSDPPKPPKGGTRKRGGWTDRLLAAKPVAEVVLGKLSERTKRQYSADTIPHVEHIARLLDDGFSEQDMRLVVWERCREWLEPKPGQTDMRQYLRPSTLFSRTKFAEYLPLAREAWNARQNDQRKADPVADLHLPAPRGVS